MNADLHTLVLMAAAQLIAEVPIGSDADCCVFVRRLLELVYGRQRVGAVPLWRWHLWAEEGAGPWEPVLAARDAGIASVAPWLSPMQWTVVQGWRSAVDDWPPRPGVYGHTFLWCGLSAGQGLMLQSSRTKGPSISMMAEARLFESYKGGMSMAALIEPG